jgi:GT2 family glycosyltransferase
VRGRAAWLCETVALLDFEPASAAGAPAFEAGGGRIFAAAASTALAAEIAEGVTDLRTFLRRGPAAWEVSERVRLLGFLASLGTEFGLSPMLAAGLWQAREALRERRPLSLPGSGGGLELEIERLHRIDERCFYVRGKAREEAGRPAALNAISPEGELVELGDLISTHPPDGSFSALFETAHPSRGQAAWAFEAIDTGGRAVETAAAVAPDPLRTIFADAALEFAGAEALREQHVRPAVRRLDRLRRQRAEVAELVEFGTAPEAPAISLVVPLQRRVDLIEHQLAQFAADPALAACELVYVLDEPEQSALLRDLAAELFALYGLPVSLAVLAPAGGLPIACELGASLARAERLLFLGADVLPDRPGWLDALAAALDADPGVAAATAKLLYAEGAIDQAGLELSPAAATGDACLRPRLRGLHREVEPAGEAAAVAAASLSCLLVEAAALGAAGGLCGEYGFADYEGADLSRRLAEIGREVRYVPDAELYRLEGLGAEPEPLGEPYARWLHARLRAAAPSGATA